MATPPLHQRLKNRKLVEWAFAYLAGAFVVLQLLDALGVEVLSLSLVVQQAIVVWVVVGFLVTLVLSWYHGERGRQRVSTVEAIVILALVVGGGIASRSGHATVLRDEGGDRHTFWRIAVVPFSDGVDGAQSPFTVGVADGLIRLLGTIPGLQVVDRHSSFDRRVLKAGALDVGRMLNVDAVISGRVEEEDSTVLLSVRLTETTNGAELWSDELSLTAESFALDQVAWDIVDFLLGDGADDSLPPPVAGSLGSHETRRLYFRGLQNATNGDRASLELAIQYFSAAIETEPDFAPAYAALADAYLYLAADEPALAMTRVAVVQALALDSTSAEARTVLGRLFNKPGHWIDAERELRRAIQLRPSYAPAHMWLGNNLLVRGRTDEGLGAFRRAAELDPLSPQIAVGLSQALSATGALDEAVSEARRATEINPGYPWGHSTLAVALADIGRFEEATVESERAVELLNGHPTAMATLAVVRAWSGDGAAAQEILRGLRGQRGDASVLPTAVVHANLAAPDSAFAVLHRVPSWNAASRDWLRNSPMWRPLHGDARWTPFLTQLGMN